MKSSRYAMAMQPKKMAHGGMVKDGMIDAIMKKLKPLEEHEEMEFDKSKESDLSVEMDGPSEPFHDADDIINDDDLAKKILKKLFT